METGGHPLSLIVLAHLDSLATKNDPNQRKESKWNLFRSLLDQGHDGKTIREILRLIDWMLELPKELEEELQMQMQDYEKEKKMPYITSFERIGMEKGEQSGILRGLRVALKIKFGQAGLDFADELSAIHDMAKIEIVEKQLEEVQSIEELRGLIQ